jgi:hypothetical protein
VLAVSPHHGAVLRSMAALTSMPVPATSARTPWSPGMSLKVADASQDPAAAPNAARISAASTAAARAKGRRAGSRNRCRMPLAARCQASPRDGRRCPGAAISSRVLTISAVWCRRYGPG